MSWQSIWTHLSDRCAVDYGKPSTAVILSRRRSLNRTHLSRLIQVLLLCVGFCSQAGGNFLLFTSSSCFKPDQTRLTGNKSVNMIINYQKTTLSRKMIQSWRKKVNVQVCVNLSPAGGVLVLVKQQNLYRSDFELNCCKLLAFLSFTLLKTTQRLQSLTHLEVQSEPEDLFCIHWRRLSWSCDC